MKTMGKPSSTMRRHGRAHPSEGIAHVLMNRISNTAAAYRAVCSTLPEDTPLSRHAANASSTSRRPVVDRRGEADE
jgi:hypothetical protein